MVCILFPLYTGVSSVVLQKQIKDLHQEQKVLRETGLIYINFNIFFYLCFGSTRTRSVY